MRCYLLLYSHHNSFQFVLILGLFPYSKIVPANNSLRAKGIVTALVSILWKYHSATRFLHFKNSNLWTLVHVYVRLRFPWNVSERKVMNVKVHIKTFHFFSLTQLTQRRCICLLRSWNVKSNIPFFFLNRCHESLKAFSEIGKTNPLMRSNFFWIKSVKEERGTHRERPFFVTGNKACRLSVSFFIPSV